MYVSPFYFYSNFPFFYEKTAHISAIFAVQNTVCILIFFQVTHPYTFLLKISACNRHCENRAGTWRLGIIQEVHNINTQCNMSLFVLAESLQKYLIDLNREEQNAKHDLSSQRLWLYNVHMCNFYHGKGIELFARTGVQLQITTEDTFKRRWVRKSTRTLSGFQEWINEMISYETHFISIQFRVSSNNQYMIGNYRPFALN
jgi:hypothetical protein